MKKIVIISLVGVLLVGADERKLQAAEGKNYWWLSGGVVSLIGSGFLAYQYRSYRYKTAEDLKNEAQAMLQTGNFKETKYEAIESLKNRIRFYLGEAEAAAIEAELKAKWSEWTTDYSNTASPDCRSASWENASIKCILEWGKTGVKAVYDKIEQERKWSLKSFTTPYYAYLSRAYATLLMWLRAKMNMQV